MKTVLVLFAQGTEELEAVTIVNLLRRAGVGVTLAGLQGGVLEGSRGIAIQPDALLDNVLDQYFDGLVLPGGMPGTTNFRQDSRVLGLIEKMVAQDKLVAAICAAPSVLAAAGVLNGKKATCYPGCLDEFADQLDIQRDALVQDGQLITSRGPGTAMDFGLYLIELLQGADKRQEIEQSLVR